MQDPKLFEACRLSVEPQWIDYNGHMNVGYYVVAFDRASDALFDHFDAGSAYRHATNASVFVVEAHVTYERELKQGDPIRFTSQLLDGDEKRLHVLHAMHHGEEGWLAATNELMFLHIDLGTRRVAPFPPGLKAKIDLMLDQHLLLPRPPQVGRVMAIRGGRRAQVS